MSKSDSIHGKSYKKKEYGLSICGQELKYKKYSNDPNDWTCINCISIYESDILIEHNERPIHGLTKKAIINRERERRKNYLD